LLDAGTWAAVKEKIAGKNSQSRLGGGG